MYYTYILKSQKDGGYYIGHTIHLEERLGQHNGGKVRSTKGRRPLTIYYFESFSTKSEAFKREMFFKTLEGRNYLKSNSIL
jgi:putative endonuclease